MILGDDNFTESIPETTDGPLKKKYLSTGVESCQFSSKLGKYPPP